MRKKLIIFTALLFIGLGFSCEDTLTEIEETPIEEVESTGEEEEEEKNKPGENPSAG